MTRDDRTDREKQLGYPPQRLISVHGVRLKPTMYPNGRKSVGERVLDMIPLWLRERAARRPQVHRFDLDGGASLARGESEQTCVLVPHRSDGGWFARIRGMRIDD